MGNNRKGDAEEQRGSRDMEPLLEHPPFRGSARAPCPTGLLPLPGPCRSEELDLGFPLPGDSLQGQKIN